MSALLEAEGIVKRYGHVTALDGAGFTASAGEVVALIGDNGAGKSTPVKVLSGVIGPGRGQNRLEGKRIDPRSPAQGPPVRHRHASH